MARTLSLSFTSPYNQVHNINQTTHFNSSKTSFLSPNQTNPFANFPKSSNYNLILTCSTSQQSSSCSTSPTLLSPLQSGTFLSNQDLEKLQSLQNFSYFQELESGSMWVRVMRDDELDMTVGLLAESFVESMVMPKGYVKLLGILVKQYLDDRRSLMPHTATLVGFYKGNDDDDDGEGELAGTVEISFNKKGANASPPSPTPPKDSPYICNMTVKKSLRRRGIGWHLLKASEELICQMSFSRDIYLHCRMIDVAPFNMYTRAGYSVRETDSIFILLTLQRRKHLMCKQIAVSTNSSEMDVSEPSENYCS